MIFDLRFLIGADWSRRLRFGGVAVKNPAVQGTNKKTVWATRPHGRGSVGVMGKDYGLTTFR